LPLSTSRLELICLVLQMAVRYAYGKNAAPAYAGLDSA